MLPTAEPSILVVDDEPDNRQLLLEVLDGEQVSLSVAGNGREALEAIDAEEPDLVLLDVRMPVLDGIETCRRIRADPRHSSLPVIFITALDDAGSRILGKEVGADDYLTKPINSAELLARVRSLLRSKAASDRIHRQKELAEANLAQARDELVRAERLATLGTLAAGVGHELSNIGAVLRSVTSELSRQSGGIEGSLGADVLQDLKAATEHVVAHGATLLSLGKPGPDYDQEMDLREVVASTLEMLAKTGRTKHVTVRLEVPDHPVMARVNRMRVEQILLNLVANAADACEGVQERCPVIRVHLSHRSDGRALCQVSDNGTGMTEAVLERIFDPYFTTKRPGKGTGLGLPVVRRIIRTYGGELLVESRPGVGTTMSFDLPSA